MEGEEPGQGMVSVFHSPDDDFLQSRSDQGDFGHQVGGHGGCPIALLVPEE